MHAHITTNTIQIRPEERTNIHPSTAHTTRAAYMLICMHTLRCAALRCINDIQPHNFTYNNTCCRWNEFSNLRFKYASYNAFKTRYPQSVDDQTISIQIHERPKENHKIPIGSCRMSIESGNMSVDIRGCLLPPVLLN